MSGPNGSRRRFVTGLGRLAMTAPLLHGLEPVDATDPAPDPNSERWDLSWVKRLGKATDRAVFDWPNGTDPADVMALQIAARFLDNCDEVYGVGKYRPGVVINVRTMATTAALNDAAWARYELGTEYKISDPDTKEPAVRNPFWQQRRDPEATFPPVTLDALVARGAILLECDFALGHVATRLAKRLGRPKDDVHRDLRASLVPGAYLVPSGIFGLAKAQNVGCAFIRM